MTNFNINYHKFAKDLSGFYKLSIAQKRSLISKISALDQNEQKLLKNGFFLKEDLVSIFIENAIGSFSMPLGIATNFNINSKDYIIPMVVEESSVIAAASYGAKIVKKNSGFKTYSSKFIIFGQIQLFLKKKINYNEIIEKNKIKLLKYVNSFHKNLIARGGGAKDITYYFIKEINSLIIKLHIDTKEAMGANIVNTMCENLAPKLSYLLESDAGLKILSNLTDKRMSYAKCEIDHKTLKNDLMTGQKLAIRIEQAYLFAYHDIYRASTHNKGIMNGVDSVVIATGNDWRAVEAGAHSYAAITGRYLPLSKWYNQSNKLIGEINLPIAIGTIGGMTKLHPGVKIAMKILNNPNVKQLGEIISAVGLAQNLSALRALSLEGIQKGHMKLHSKNIALQTSPELFI